MDSCLGVEREVDKVLSKFNGINENANQVLQHISGQVDNLKQEFESSKLCSYHQSKIIISYPHNPYCSHF